MIFHLGGLETDELAEGMKERVLGPQGGPSRDLEAVSHWRKKFCKGSRRPDLVRRENEFGKKATVGGLNTPGSMLDWTLSRLTGRDSLSERVGET
jgi:hypothetical protein